MATLPGLLMAASTTPAAPVSDEIDLAAALAEFLGRAYGPALLAQTRPLCP